MGCGATKSKDIVATDETEDQLCFKPTDATAFVSDTGAGFGTAFGKKVEPSFKYLEPMLVEAMPPGSLPDQHLHESGSESDADKQQCVGSLIMKHPPRKAQRLEEEQALMAVRSPKHKMVSSTTRINQKPTIQDVPEEDEEAENDNETAVA